MYAIVDIETTGGKFNEECITELAIIRYANNTILDQFSSLINPLREIQPFVQKLTGINSNMVKNAPKFYQVAKRIIEITEGCILVAHNSNFDYRILKIEFERLGYEFRLKTICTVALSKKILPNIESYKLSRITKALGIPIGKSHRAMNDAQATLKLFKILLSKDKKKLITKSMIKNINPIKDKYIKLIDNISEEIGVLYLYDKSGKIFFISRSENIKRSLINYIVGEKETDIKIRENINNVSYEKTGNKLISIIKEYNDLISLKPKLKKKSKNIDKYDFKKDLDFRFEDDNFLIIDKGNSHDNKSFIWIKNHNLIGYGFFNLNHQINNSELLKKLVVSVKYPEKILSVIKYFYKIKKFNSIVKIE